MNFRHGEIFICVSDFFPLHPFAGALDLRFAVEFFFSPLFFFFFFFSTSLSRRVKSRIPGQCLTATVPGRFHFPCLTDD